MAGGRNSAGVMGTVRAGYRCNGRRFRLDKRGLGRCGLDRRGHRMFDARHSDEADARDTARCRHTGRRQHVDADVECVGRSVIERQVQVFKMAALTFHVD